MVFHMENNIELDTEINLEVKFHAILTPNKLWSSSPVYLVAEICGSAAG